MNRNRYYELCYYATAYDMWSEEGPYRNTDLVREVRIQAKKLMRMLGNRDLGMSEEELRGEPVSKSLRKRRGKLHEQAERQFKKVTASFEDAVQQAAMQRLNRRLTKAELSKHASEMREKINSVIKLMKEKYPLKGL